MEEQEIHLRDYYLVLLKHRLLIFAFLVLTVAVTLFFSLQMKPVYRATATLLIDNPLSTSPLTGERIDYESYVSQSLTFNTHFKLITSRPVLEKVISELHLDERRGDSALQPGAFRELLQNVKANIRLLLGMEEIRLTPEERKNALLDRLRQKIEIREVSDTRLLQIVVEDTDPELARGLANSVGETYIDFDRGNRLRTNQNSFQWLSDQFYELKKKLEDAERDFLAYKEREKIFSVAGRQQTIAQKIADMNDASVKTRNQRLELEARLEALEAELHKPEVDIFQYRSLLENPVLEKLDQQYLEAELEVSRLSQVYRHMHPKMVQARTRLEDTGKKIREETEKELANMRTRREILQAREKVLQKNISDFEQEALDLNRKELQYTMLQRNVETNKKLYDTLLAKLKESDVTESRDLSTLRMAEAAVIPTAPVKPRLRLNLMLSLVLGLMGGIGLAFFLEYMDRSLRTEEDVQRYLDLPVLSVVPVAGQAGAGYGYGSGRGRRPRGE